MFHAVILRRAGRKIRTATPKTHLTAKTTAPNITATAPIPMSNARRLKRERIQGNNASPPQKMTTDQ
jgi:hypothetical protein